MDEERIFCQHGFDDVWRFGMIPKATAKAHIIHMNTGEMLSKQHMHGHVPRVGDEIRLHGPRYYKVEYVIWIYDEPECELERVNIGVIEADDK